MTAPGLGKKKPRLRRDWRAAREEGGMRLLDLPLDWSSESWECRPIGQTTASAWVPRYHYSGDIGHTGAHFFGVFCPDMIAVIGLGPPTNAFGLARHFELQWPGNREITRVAVHPEAPRFTASRSVAMFLRSLKMDTRTDWVFAYADVGAGHHGGLYQALNAVYVGANIGGPPPPEWEIYEADSWRPIAARSLQRKCGSGRRGAIDRLARRGIRVRIVADEKSPKHTYILPTAPPKTARAIRNHLKEWALPYPLPIEVAA